MATTNEREIHKLIKSVKADPLKPERWQALGKALNWPIYGLGKTGVIEESEIPYWEYQALYWFQSVLNGTEDKFWSELT